MKKLFKLTTVVFLSMACAVLSVAAHENEEESDEQAQEPVYQPEANFQRYDTNREVGEGRRYRRHDGLGQLQREVEHLNGMVAHVRNSMRRYRADRHVWQEYAHLQAEVRQINQQFRRGDQYYDRRRLRAQIAHMHAELHHIEQELRVPARAYYQWGG